MHELAVTSSILDIVVREAQRAGAARVTRVALVIGELSSIIDDAVQQYFSFVSEGTLAEHAVLDFTRIPATLRCRDCAHTYTKQGSNFACPLCGGEGTLTGDAKDFYIESIEVE